MAIHETGMSEDANWSDGPVERVVRAVLRAIREPDEALVADALGPVVTGFESEVVHRTARATFTAMIDSILSEATEPNGLTAPPQHI